MSKVSLFSARAEPPSLVPCANSNPMQYSCIQKIVNFVKEMTASLSQMMGRSVIKPVPDADISSGLSIDAQMPLDPGFDPIVIPLATETSEEAQTLESFQSVSKQEVEDNTTEQKKPTKFERLQKIVQTGKTFVFHKVCEYPLITTAAAATLVATTLLGIDLAVRANRANAMKMAKNRFAEEAERLGLSNRLMELSSTLIPDDREKIVIKPEPQPALAAAPTQVVIEAKPAKPSNLSLTADYDKEVFRQYMAGGIAIDGEDPLSIFTNDDEPCEFPPEFVQKIEMQTEAPTQVVVKELEKSNKQPEAQTRALEKAQKAKALSEMEMNRRLAIQEAETKKQAARREAQFQAEALAKAKKTEIEFIKEHNETMRKFYEAQIGKATEAQKQTQEKSTNREKLAIHATQAASNGSTSNNTSSSQSPSTGNTGLGLNEPKSPNTTKCEITGASKVPYAFALDKEFINDVIPTRTANIVMKTMPIINSISRYANHILDLTLTPFFYSWARTEAKQQVAAAPQAADPQVAAPQVAADPPVAAPQVEAPQVADPPVEAPPVEAPQAADEAHAANLPGQGRRVLPRRAVTLDALNPLKGLQALLGLLPFAAFLAGGRIRER